LFVCQLQRIIEGPEKTTKGEVNGSQLKCIVGT
jgi:hypothetical protein